MLTKVEWAILAALLAGAGALLAWIGKAQGWSSDAMASWVQAVGTIGAVLLVALPVLVQHRLDRRHSRAVVLAATEMAYAVMKEVADRYLNPNYVGSEWWVPQWDVLQKTLADCPIQQTGSADALMAFVEFQQIFARASAFDEPPANAKAGTLDSMVVALMSNADLQLNELRRTLGPKTRRETRR